MSSEPGYIYSGRPNAQYMVPPLMKKEIELDVGVCRGIIIEC
jgi:hypothetical protein